MKKCSPIQIFRHINKFYGDVMKEASVWNWCIMFNGGRTNVHDEEYSGWLSVVTDKLKSKIEEEIKEHRNFTIDGLCLFFPEISLTVVYEIKSWFGLQKSVWRVGFLNFVASAFKTNGAECCLGCSELCFCLSKKGRYMFFN